MIVGCYSLVLYCDAEHSHSDYAYGRHMGEATGNTYRECARTMRKRGWTLMESTGQCFCKRHRKEALRVLREVKDALLKIANPGP
jgi:hypothetical protein